MNDLIRKYVNIDNTAVGERQIRIIASDATVDRVGDVLVPSGCDISDYMANPIVLAQHDPTKPVGKSVPAIKPSRVEALIDFPPAGVSAIADEYCGLAKAEIINAASVGFEPVESEPIKGGGRRYTKWKLLEISLVSVPANPSAVVIVRSATLAPRHRGELSTRADPFGGRTDWTPATAGDAWLKAEWPGQPWAQALRKEAALVSRLSRRALARRLARKADARKSFDRAKCQEDAERRLYEQMTPEQQHAHRRAVIARLERSTPAASWTPYRWDPYLDAPTNSQLAKQNELRRRS